MSDMEREPTEMELLKQRADLLGVTYSNNIGIETLRKRVEDAMAGNPQDPEPESAEAAIPSMENLTADLTAQVAASSPVIAKGLNPLVQDEAPVQSKPISLREHMRLTQLKLVRVRIQNLDPKKSNLPGEIFAVANEYLGDVKKYIPFGEVTDNGYHIPYCLYKMLKNRRFLNVRERKDRDGKIHVETSWVKEFALELLPDLSPEELKQLATAQIAANSGK
jgi:hypothetical protein